MTRFEEFRLNGASKASKVEGSWNPPGGSLGSQLGSGPRFVYMSCKCLNRKVLVLWSCSS